MLALALAGCGGGEDGPATLERASSGLAKLRSGTLHLKVTLTPEGGSGPVGVGLDGPFDLAAGTPLAVADLRVTRYLGAKTSVVRVVSTGRQAWAGPEGALQPLAPDAARDIVSPEGLSAVDLGRWIRDPAVSDGPTVAGDATDRISGRVDVDAVLREAAKLAGVEGGSVSAAAVTGDKVELLTGAKDGLLRRLSARARLVLPERLKALVPSAAPVDARIDVSVRRPNGKVTVRAPG